MLITRTSIITGIERTLEIDVTLIEIEKWQSGTLIQFAMPRVSMSDREFIMSGITTEEWLEEFGTEDEA